MEVAFKQYLSYFENLTPDSISQIRNLAEEDIHFVDPFNDVRSVEQVIEIFSEMFQRLREPRFSILDTSSEGDRMFCEWSFSFSHPIIRLGRPHSFDGVSVIRLSHQGKVQEHRDYWDTGNHLFRHVPVLGWGVHSLLRYFA